MANTINATDPPTPRREWNITLEDYGYGTDRFPRPHLGNSAPEMCTREWVEDELIPLLQVAYGHRLGFGQNHDFWEDVQRMQALEPARATHYPFNDKVFIERVRLALYKRDSHPEDSTPFRISRNINATIGLLLRVYTVRGEYPLASLGRGVQLELAEEVHEAEKAEQMTRKLFERKQTRQASEELSNASSP